MHIRDVDDRLVLVSPVTRPELELVWWHHDADGLGAFVERAQASASGGVPMTHLRDMGMLSSGESGSERSPAGQVLARVLQQRDLWSDGGQRAFTDSDDAYIDLFCVLNTPYQPVVFDSLMKPIAAEWGARNKTLDTRAEFWRWRRARPLTEFLPMAPQVRLAMVRGWFTAGLLGQLRLDWQHGCTLFVPSEGGGRGAWAELPQPLLAADVQFEYEYLPAVLKSVLLAMLEVNGTTSLLPMAPYARLRQLGRSGRGGEYSAYEAPATELEDWVIRGVVASGAPDPTAFAGPAKGTVSERREAVLTRLAKQRNLYEGLFASVRNRSDVFDVPRAFELAGDIMSALDDLHRAVRHVEEMTDAVAGWN